MAERLASAGPGMQAAIQIRPVLVTNNIQYPQQFARPAATFVVVCNDSAIRW